MTGDMPMVLDFSQWKGEPFFKGLPEEGRHVYLVRNEASGTFLAFGVLDRERRIVFKVRGKEEDLERFLAQVRTEGASITNGAPPFDTNTGGDKPGSDTTRPGRR